MLGFHIFKSIGVAAVWVVGNAWRKIMRKSFRSYRDIWNGGSTDDELDHMGYELFFLGVGCLLFLFVVMAIRLFS